VVVNEAKGAEFKAQIVGTDIADMTVLIGAEALVTVATLESVDSVMAAIVGAAGLLSALAAAQAGKTVLLANKESLVMSGENSIHWLNKA
jgi:1-deoxy-D-xylulose-5-phosphate reductoisomerase